MFEFFSDRVDVFEFVLGRVQVDVTLLNQRDEFLEFREAADDIPTKENSPLTRACAGSWTCPP